MTVKKLLIVGVIVCVPLFATFSCCGGFLYWGYTLNIEEARRDYAAAEQLWSTGQKADAAAKYKGIKQTYLSDAEKETLAKRLKEYATEEANKELVAGHQEWTSGRKEQAVAHYRALQTDLLEASERELVADRIREFDRAKAQADLQTAEQLWASGERQRAVALYKDVLLDLVERPQVELVTQRLYEGAGVQWVSNRKAEAVAIYRKLDKNLLTQAERDTVAERIGVLEALEQRIAKAEKTRFGKKVQLKAFGLHATSSVTAEETVKAALYLEAAYGDADHAIDGQINKEGKTYQYRMVVKKGANLNEELMTQFKQLARTLSQEVFGGAPVEVHLCDEQFKTLRVASMAE